MLVWRPQDCAVCTQARPIFAVFGVYGDQQGRFTLDRSERFKHLRTESVYSSRELFNVSVTLTWAGADSIAVVRRSNRLSCAGCSKQYSSSIASVSHHELSKFLLCNGSRHWSQVPESAAAARPARLLVPVFANAWYMYMCTDELLQALGSPVTHSPHWHVNDVGFRQPLDFVSLPLVEKLFSDLVHTTESLKQLKVRYSSCRTQTAHSMIHTLI